MILKKQEIKHTESYIIVFLRIDDDRPPCGNCKYNLRCQYIILSREIDLLVICHLLNSSYVWRYQPSIVVKYIHDT